MPSLADTRKQTSVVIRTIGGPRAFRRRLMEMGLVPGTPIQIIDVAPLGDPLEIEVRNSRLSIRRSEAAQIEVVAAP